MHKQSEVKVVAKPGEERLVAKALQQLAREEMKHRLLADILTDINVCKIEGWDYKEYLLELKEIVCRYV